MWYSCAKVQPTVCYNAVAQVASFLHLMKTKCSHEWGQRSLLRFHGDEWLTGHGQTSMGLHLWPSCQHALMSCSIDDACLAGSEVNINITTIRKILLKSQKSRYMYMYSTFQYLPVDGIHCIHVCLQISLPDLKHHVNQNIVMPVWLTLELAGWSIFHFFIISKKLWSSLGLRFKLVPPKYLKYFCKFLILNWKSINPRFELECPPF